MPGPNSAPNGNGSLVRGSSREEFHVDEKTGKVTPMREWLRIHGRLETGKTK